jgi:hypothetical protein
VVQAARNLAVLHGVAARYACAALVIVACQQLLGVSCLLAGVFLGRPERSVALERTGPTIAGHTRLPCHPRWLFLDGGRREPDAQKIDKGRALT